MNYQQRAVAAVALVLTGCATAQQEKACEVCKNGDNVTIFDKQLQVPGLGLISCGQIEQSLLAASDACGVVQALGSLCGCSVVDTACRLCPDVGHVISVPDRLLDDLVISYLLPSAPESDDLVSCEILEAVLLGISKQGDTFCQNSQLQYSGLCGCGPGVVNEGEGPESNNRHTSLDSSSPQQDNTTTPAICTICKNGEEISIPDKKVDLGPTFPFQNCGQLASFAASLSPESEKCFWYQSLGSLCGCPVPKNSCSYCANGEPVAYPEKTLDWDLGGFEALDESLTCGLMDSALHSLDPDGSTAGIENGVFCIVAHMRSSACGCDPSWRGVLMLWVYRGLAILSLSGSSLILYDILMDKKKRATTYHQAIIGISSFDMVSSIAFALAGVLLPKSSGFYGAKGSDATCTLQGFLIQLGFASIFYNVALSWYYLLVVRYNWKENKLKKYRKYVHATAIFLGIGLACGALPFYGQYLTFCYIAAYSRVPMTIFFTIPLGLSLIFVTGSISIVCWTVYRQEKKVMKWKARKNLDMTKNVVLQSLFYAASFYVTFPLLIVSSYVDYDRENHYWLAVAGSVGSAQGLLNALVYFYRSRGNRMLSCCRIHSSEEKKPNALKQLHGQHSSPPNPSSSRIPVREEETKEEECRLEDVVPKPQMSSIFQQLGKAPTSPLDVTEGASHVPDEGTDSCYDFEAAAELWQFTQED